MEFDYQNTSLNTSEINTTGDELNHSVLNNTDSRAGAREFNYSNKTSSTGDTSTPSSIKSDELSKAVETNTVTEVTTTTSSVATTVGTTAAVGGIVVATVVMFTSLLGNQFKLMDDSLSLSLSRDVENQQINLDYSFDLEYDKSGSVLVKMVSTAHTLVSEEYKIVYEGKEQEIIEYEEGEEPKQEEHVKDIYSVTIEGSFYSLIEKNEYTFVIASVIDGIESQIYTKQVYIPSSYVDVIEFGHEEYFDDEQINMSYFFMLEYESEAEAYVELKHINKSNEVIDTQISEIYKLEEDSLYKQEETNKYIYSVEGSFLNLVNQEEYILSVISTVNEYTNTSYSDRFVVNVAKPVIEEYEYSFVEQPYVSFDSYYGTLFLEYGASIVPLYDGVVVVNVIDTTAQSTIYTREYEILESDSGGFVLADSVADIVLGHRYGIEFTSIIDEHEADIYTNSYLADGEFGYVDEDNASFEATSYTDNQKTTHEFIYSFDFYTKMDGTNLKMEIEDSNNSVIYEDVLLETFTWENATTSSEYNSYLLTDSIELEVGGPYTVNIYATYGAERLLSTFTVYENVIEPLSLVGEPSVNFATDQGNIVLSFSASAIGKQSGKMRVDINDASKESTIYSKLFDVDATQADGTAIYDSCSVQVGEDYKIVFTSIVEEHESEIFSQIYTADGDFAEILNNSSFSSSYYADENLVVHNQLDFNISFLPHAFGTNLTMRVYNSKETMLSEDIYASTFDYMEEPLSYEGSIDLSSSGPYVVKIFATFATEHLLFTTNVEQTTPDSYEFVNEPDVTFGILDMGTYMTYDASVNPIFDGSVDVTVTDVDEEEEVVYNYAYSVSALESDSGQIRDSIQIDATHQYRLKMVSVIGNHHEEIFNKTYYPDGEFMEISEDTSFSAVSYPDATSGETVHKLTYDVYYLAYASGTNLSLCVYDYTNELLEEEIIVSSFNASVEMENASGTIYLDVGGPYIVKVFATFHTEYELFYAEVEEQAALSYDIYEEDIELEVYYEDTVQVDVRLEFNPDIEGSIYFELVKNTSGESITGEPHTVIVDQSQAFSAFESFEIEDISSSYTLKVHSVINEIDVICVTKFVDTNIEYGQIIDGITTESINNNGVMNYNVRGYFSAFKSCSVFAIFEDDEGNSFTTNIEGYGDLEDHDFVLTIEDQLTPGVDYTVSVYANWGQGDKLMDTTLFTPVYYGLTADTDNAISDYNNSTYVVTISIDDPEQFLTDFHATLEFPDMVSMTHGNTFEGEIDMNNGTITFNLQDASQGDLATLVITAIDTSNNNVTATFVNIDIIY